MAAAEPASPRAQEAARDRIAEAFTLLQREQPRFHYVDSIAQQWSIGPATLRWMLDYLPRAGATLETGCGFSTVLFAAAGTRHTVVTPVREELARVRQFCEQHGIRADTMREIVGDSSRVLADLELPELGLVLIDGAHAFPVPCIDWYFTQSALRPTGHLVVDDFRMPSVALLVRFLRAERRTWRQVGVTGNSVIFEKLAHDDFSRDWEGQFINRNAMRPPFIRRVGLKLRRIRRDVRDGFARQPS